MKTRLLLISGWAHGTHTLQPMADRLAPLFDIQLLELNPPEAFVADPPRLSEGPPLLRSWFQCSSRVLTLG